MGENIKESKNESSVSENSSRDVINGEYHFANPERRLYEDAEYASDGEYAEVPRYYVPSEKKVKEKPEKHRSGLLRTVCICLACAIIGGLAGAGATVYMSRDTSSSSEHTQITGTPIVASESTDKASSNANNIYAVGCQQVVGITTSVSYTDFFGQESSAEVSGSGFVVTADGYILTNYHVIEYAYESSSSATVVFKDGTAYDAVIVGVEPENDLAVLKIDATGLTPVTIGDSSSIQVGDTVYAIGNPLGELDFSMTTGSISALDRSITTETSAFAINMFQFDAAVNSGNSGGPVYNTDGQVIGIVTAKSGVEGTEGLGFAIPINDAVSIANELITNGYVSGKAYMGVSIDTRFTSVYADYYGIPEGAYVYSVESGSCADEAGLRAGDIITAIGDTEISDYSDLTSALRQYSAGDTVKLKVYREDKHITLTITFDESQPSTESKGNEPASGYSHKG